MEGSLSALFLDQHITALSEQNNEELRHQLFCARMELESARAAAIAQNSLLESRSHYLEEQLKAVQRERDEANKQCRKLQEQLACMSSSSSSSPFLRDTPPLHSPTSVIGSEFPWRLSDICPELSMNYNENPNPVPNPNPSQFHLDHSSFSLDMLDDDALLPWAGEERPGNQESMDDSRVSTMHLPEPPEADIEVMLKSLPEKGKLLQAVLHAGPLLQSLLLAGPLPEWRHAPPPVGSALSRSYLPCFEQSFCFDSPKISSSRSLHRSPSLPVRLDPDPIMPLRFAKLR